MYLPAHFEESNIDVLHDLIRQFSLGTMVTQGPNGLDANHIPFELDAERGEAGVLSGHVARANPVWNEVADGDEVLVIFKAGDAYISPNWYPSKHITHQQVPTWNYRVVHAHGRISVRDDERFVRGVVARLTRRHEASQPVPWKMTDSPKALIDGMLTAIVGLEVEITRLVGKSKLSQNKEAADIRGAGEALTASGRDLIGDAMLGLVRPDK